MGTVEKVLGRFQAALNAFDAPLHTMSPQAWDAGTPCTEWDVRALVNHVVGELRWVPELLAGRTVAEVGDALAGDVLGADPCAAWHHACNAAHEAAAEPGVLARTVHLSYGDTSAQDYCEQLTVDALVHAWDLARAVGADDALAPDLVAWARGYVEEHAAELAGSGLFAPPAPVADGADPQTALLAVLGRAR